MFNKLIKIQAIPVYNSVAILCTIMYIVHHNLFFKIMSLRFDKIFFCQSAILVYFNPNLSRVCPNKSRNKWCCSMYFHKSRNHERYLSIKRNPVKPYSLSLTIFISDLHVQFKTNCSICNFQHIYINVYVNFKCI